MIFQHTLQLVLSGRKTQTRRIRRPRVVAGRSYAVQRGRGQKAVGRIIVEAVRPERLGDVSLIDARAEGYASRADFFAAWSTIHGDVDHDALVWVVKFRLGVEA